LCDYLVVIGFLTKSKDEYNLTPDTAMFLVRSSPAYAGSAARFLAAPVQTENFKNVAAAVRKGGAVEARMFGPEHPVWVDFARGMAPLMTLAADLIAELLEAENAQRGKVLDVAAGHGLYGIAIAKRNSNARVTAVDWPNVLTVAKENAETARVLDRYDTIPGSAFDVDFGGGYDVALITNFLHMFDDAANQKLLQKVHAALKPGGRAVALEFVPDDDRVSPPIAASFALTMLVNTPTAAIHTRLRS
jgi:SAM-dependent methyltransferase